MIGDLSIGKALAFAFIMAASLPWCSAEDAAQGRGSVAVKASGDLTIEVTGLANDKGEVRIGVASEKKVFDDASFTIAANVKPKDMKVTHVFKALPFGEYAVKVYHDENSNGKLDTNFFGVPKERYGASNNARSSFGPPEFEKALFKLDKPALTLSIKAE